MIYVFSVLAQTEIDANKAISQAAGLGELVYVLVVAMFLVTALLLAIGAPLLFKGILPAMQEKRERENKLADSHVETNSRLTLTAEKQVQLLTEVRTEHHDFRQEVRDEFGKVHDRFNSLKNNPPL